MISSFYFDKGNFASVQQDALVLEIAVFGKREAALLAVCDGIGGLDEGEYASSYVTMRIRSWFYDSYLKHVKKRHGRKLIERDCTGMLYDCNRYLQRYGEEHGMKLGTTMTMVLLQGRRMFAPWRFCFFMEYMLFHVGDCRAYVIGKTCKKLTHDDSGKNCALRKCIGSFPWQDVQKKRGHLFYGEKLLVCSDGFWRRLEEEEILTSFGKKQALFIGGRLTEAQLEKRLCKLGQAARERGERDNQAAAIAARVNNPVACSDGGCRLNFGKGVRQKDESGKLS